MALLEVSDIRKTEDENLILRNISFQLQAGQKMAISGESGAGKTSLLKTIAGLSQPDSGAVIFDGQRIEGPHEKLIPGHRRIAYLSQHYELRNHYRVNELLNMANELIPDEAMNVYSVCRIDHLLERWTHQLSGGEKQRIALARLLTSSPSLLLLDEPFSNLDPIHTNILRSVIDDVAARLHITCMLSSHDPYDTLSWADTIVVMKDGDIVQQDTPQMIYQYPLNDYVAGMFGRFIAVDEKLLTLFPEAVSINKKYLRSENFKIGDGQKPVRLTVMHIRYMGSHFEIGAAANGCKVIVRSSQAYAPGDVIDVQMQH